jgi:uncharacterized protein
MDDAQYWINQLGLKNHPEGGHYKEVYRSEEQIEGIHLREKRNGTRSLSTSIFFLLRSGEKSCLHRIKSDEIWYFHAGSPLAIHSVNQSGDYVEKILGSEHGKQQHLQCLIPAGTIFGAEVVHPGAFSLVGCMVTPGFSFEDFEIMTQQCMLELYPRHKELILKLTCEGKQSTLYY